MSNQNHIFLQNVSTLQGGYHETLPKKVNNQKIVTLHMKVLLSKKVNPTC